MSRHILPLLIALLNLFVSSALAQSTPKWESMAGEFKCGFATKYESGAVTVDQAASLAASNWDACEAQYGHGACNVQAKGFTVGPQVCDYDQKLHDPLDGSLGDVRAEELYNAFATLRPQADGHRLPNRVFMDTAVKKAYLVISPKSGVVALALQAPKACGDKLDNDGDRLTDYPDDPGCESPQDDDEWNAKPIPTGDARWAGMLAVIDREAATPCPVTITGYWALEPRSEGGDGEYHFRYGVDYPYCPKQCRTGDVSDESGFQMMSPKGIAQAAMQHPDAIQAALDGASGALTWTEFRVHIEAPERVPGIEYVDAGGNVDTEMWYGRAADVDDRGDVMVVSFKSICEDLIAAELEQEYTGVDFVVAGGGTFQGSVVGDGVTLTTHPSGSLVAEVGIEVGTGHTAFIGTVGFGGYFDDNCNMPAAWMPQARLGLTFNRMGQFGAIVDVRGQYSFAPSYGITPDDPDTDENEYAAYSDLGTNAFGLFVDVGPRIAFGQRGVHQGWIAPTLTAGPKLRWFDDNVGQQRVTLTADIGASLNIGWDW